MYLESCKYNDEERNLYLKGVETPLLWLYNFLYRAAR